MLINKPGKKFAYSATGWDRDIYDKVVKKTRKNLVPYSDIQRTLMYCRGNIDEAAKMIQQKKIPSNPDVMLDFYNRLCDLEEAVNSIQISTISYGSESED